MARTEGMSSATSSTGSIHGGSTSGMSTMFPARQVRAGQAIRRRHHHTAAATQATHPAPTTATAPGCPHRQAAPIKPLHEN